MPVSKTKKTFINYILMVITMGVMAKWSPLLNKEQGREYRRRERRVEEWNERQKQKRDDRRRKGEGGMRKGKTQEGNIERKWNTQ